MYPLEKKKIFSMPIKSCDQASIPIALLMAI